MRKADKLLVDYYDDNYRKDGRPEAVKKLKEVIVKGVNILVDMPEEPQSKRAKLVVQETQNGRGDQIIGYFSTTVQDTHKKNIAGMMTGVVMNGMGMVKFLPEFEERSTRGNQLKWEQFLAKLKPKCFAVANPATRDNRIPYFDGVWYGHMEFLPTVPPEILDEIVEIKGNFDSRSEVSLLDKNFIVRGDLHVQVEMIRSSNSCITELGGNMYLYAEKNGQLKYATALTTPPQRLMSWGLSEDKILCLGGVVKYKFMTRQRDGEKVYILAEVRDKNSTEAKMMDFFWNGQAWIRMEAELPMEVANAVRHKLGRFRTFLCLGKDYIRDHADFNRDNISRLIVFFDICLGIYDKERVKKPGLEVQAAMTGMANSLERVSALLDVSGLTDELEINQRAEDINLLLDGIDEDALRMVADDIQNLDPLDVKKIRQDQQYLGLMFNPGSGVNDFLQTAGRTLVFLNNIFVSKETRSRASKMIAELRKLLRKVEDKKKADRRLIQLLKDADGSLVKSLAKAYPDKHKEVADLNRKLKLLNAKNPLDIIKDFQYAPYKTESDQLLEDRDFLLKALNLGPSGVDDLFSHGGESGTIYDMDGFKNLLKVNLVSFMNHEVRTEHGLFDGKSPSEVAGEIKDRLDALLPGIKVFNTIVSGG